MRLLLRCILPFFLLSSAAASLAVLSLQSYERQGGHTIERHVGKSDRQLIERLRKNQRISASSTFYDLKAAERAVRYVLRKKRNKVRRWLKKARPGMRLALFQKGKIYIGKGIKRRERRIRKLKNIRVILKCIRKSKFIILTAYPT